jgi:hypothetical protein
LFFISEKNKPKAALKSVEPDEQPSSTTTLLPLTSSEQISSTHNALAVAIVNSTFFAHKQYKLNRGFTAADLGSDCSDISDKEIDDDENAQIDQTRALLNNKSIVQAQPKPKSTKQATMRSGALDTRSLSIVKPKNHQTVPLCEVCDLDKVNGRHFGVMVCCKCATFFANSFTREYYKQKCVGGGRMRCDVSGVNREKCRKCRLLQCLRAGMRPNSQTQYKNALNYVHEHQQLALEILTKRPQQQHKKQGKQRGALTSRQSLPNINLIQSTSRLYSLCQVCRMDTPIGYRYGAYTCASCLAFFQRSFDKAFFSRYKCINGNERCDISGSNRISCRKCRLNKCLNVGMLPTKQSMLNKVLQYLSGSKLSSRKLVAFA